MEKQIIEILKEHIEELKDVEIKADTALISSGYLESFDIIGIIVSLEEAFDAELPLGDMELEDFNTVRTIEEMIKRIKG